MNTPALRPIARLRRTAPEDGFPAGLAGEWSVFWETLSRKLRRDGYRPATVRVYRQILRDLRDYLRDTHGIARPGGMTIELAEAFLTFLSHRNVSWSWMASAITVLRTAFDKCSGLALTAHMTTPRRNWPLPEALSERELRRLCDALPNPRDRLLVALLAGCGLRVSEVCSMRWSAFDSEGGTLRVEDPSQLRSRTVAVPQTMLPLLRSLRALSRPTEPMVCGRRRDQASAGPLSVRQAERLIQAAGRRAGILKRVSPMVLRHTYAIRRIAAGENIRAVQQALGHHCVKTTLRYRSCLPPRASPLNADPPELTLKKLAVLVDRLATVAAATRQATPAQGP